MIKLREEADPFSMDLGILKSGEVVKVLEVSAGARRGRGVGAGVTTRFDERSAGPLLL